VFDIQDDREVLVAQIDSMRDYIRILTAENAEMKNAEMFLLNEIRRREIEIGMIHNSRTWKSGRLMLSPVRIVRTISRRIFTVISSR
jgi:hypothetical protein